MGHRGQGRRHREGQGLHRRARCSARPRTSRSQMRKVPITPAALVVGGGIAGIQAALDLADAGVQVYLVEREPTHRRPHGDVRQDLPDARLLGLHPDAEDDQRRPAPEHQADDLLRGRGGHRATSATSRSRSGARPPTSTTTSATAAACAWRSAPTRRRASSTRGCRTRKAIYMPFPQAVPNKPVIDAETCVRFKGKKCKACIRSSASQAPSTSSRRTGSRRSRSARSSWPPASRPMDAEADPAARLRPAARGLHRARVRAAQQRRRPDARARS